MDGPEKRFARWLAATGVIYALGALDFTVRPEAATRSLSQAGKPGLPDEEPGVYNALASAYMATIASLALAASKDPSGRRELIPPLLVAKATSSAGFLYRFFKTRRPGHALGAAIDAGLLGVTAGLYNALDD
jgi:hypothetical protein